MTAEAKVPAGSPAFSCEVTEGFAALRAHRGAFTFGLDLEVKHNLFDLLSGLKNNPDVRAVLLFNDQDAFSLAEHRRYVDTIQEAGGARAAQLLEREQHALTQLALLARTYEKPLVCCLDGEIATPFFGFSLACDLRVASEHLVYRLSHAELGVPPTGGLGYLLPRFVGPGRAAEWLLCGGEIDAHSALHAGLANVVLETVKFEQACHTWVRRALANGPAHFSLTRRLLYDDQEAFAAYLEREGKLRLKALAND